MWILKLWNAVVFHYFFYIKYQESFLLFCWQGFVFPNPLTLTLLERGQEGRRQERNPLLQHTNCCLFLTIVVNHKCQGFQKFYIQRITSCIYNKKLEGGLLNVVRHNIRQQYLLFQLNCFLILKISVCSRFKFQNK